MDPCIQISSNIPQPSHSPGNAAKEEKRKDDKGCHNVIERGHKMKTLLVENITFFLAANFPLTSNFN